MKSSFLKNIGRLWLVGGVMLALRVVQNRVGFDSEGLAVPNLPGKALAGLIVAAFLVEVILCLRLPKAPVPFSQQFASPEKSLMAAICGCMLLVFGGGLLVFESLQAGSGIAPLAAGVLAVLADIGLVVLIRQLKNDEIDSVLPLLPALFFSVFLVLTIYLGAEGDPVLARFYPAVLASSMTAFAFAQLSGFLMGEGSSRRFTPTADLAVMLSLASMSDGSRATALLFGGCTIILSVFLWLQCNSAGTSSDA